MFEKIRLFYEKGLWSASMVRQAADKGLLSREQYRQIVEPLPDADGEGVAADG